MKTKTNFGILYRMMIVATIVTKRKLDFKIGSQFPITKQGMFVAPSDSTLKNMNVLSHTFFSIIRLSTTKRLLKYQFPDETSDEILVQRLSYCTKTYFRV